MQQIGNTELLWFLWFKHPVTFSPSPHGWTLVKDFERLLTSLFTRFKGAKVEQVDGCSISSNVAVVMDCCWETESLTRWKSFSFRANLCPKPLPMAMSSGYQQNNITNTSS